MCLLFQCTKREKHEKTQENKFHLFCNHLIYLILKQNAFLFFYYFQAKLETKALKAKRPGFTDERYHETSYYIENGKNFQFILSIWMSNKTKTKSYKIFQDLLT